jgi:hypothetical protein
MASVIRESVLLSNNQRWISSLDLACRPYFHTKSDSIKQCVVPESTNNKFGTGGIDKLITRDIDRERAEAFIFTSICMQCESTQPFECAEAIGSLTIVQLRNHS